MLFLATTTRNNLVGSALILAATAMCCRAFAQGPEKVFPDSAVVNVKTAYGARGDGIADDTVALQKAIHENVGTGHILYFPSGTYLVRRRLEGRKADGTWWCGLTFQGQSRSATTIRLCDHADGYSDPLRPRGVIHTGSQPGGPYDPANGSGFNAFRNYIFDLTVDAGNGNPGAIGIDYIANNNGEIGNVTIRSGEPQGHAGIALTRSPGPCLIENVAIEGFDYGVVAKHLQHGVTFEHLSLSRQRVAGIRNEGNVLSLRDLRSTGTVPVIQNVAEADGHPLGMICVVDGNFHGTGDASACSAIDNQSILFARNVTAAGYLSVIKNPDGDIAGPTVAEYCSGQTRSLFATSEHSLSLPVQETPEGFDPDLSHWESVGLHGANPNDETDDTAAIQHALDAGKSTVYFPGGRYLISDTLHVRGGVKHLFGCESNLCVRGTGFDDGKAPRSMFRFEGPNDVIVQGFDLNLSIPFQPRPGLLFLEHASPCELTLKFLAMYGQIDAAYRAAPDAGNLFLEDVSGQANGVGWFLAPNQQVWARQWNPEGNRTMITNRGARLWILGIKTEGLGTVIETTEKGQTELLGGLLYPSWGDPGRTPAFDITDSTATLTYATLDFNFPIVKNYAVQVRQTQGTQTKSLELDGNRVLVPLFVGSKL
jgi:hypothetical protein